MAIFSAALFVFFMVCHGELATRRPSARYLTSFYLMVSVGGALGGLLVGFVFPYVLPASDRLAAIVLSLTAFLFAWLLWREYSAQAGDSLKDENIMTGPHDKLVMTVLTVGAIVFVAARVATAKYAGAPPFFSKRHTVMLPLFSYSPAAFVEYILWRSRGGCRCQ